MTDYRVPALAFLALLVGSVIALAHPRQPAAADTFTGEQTKAIESVIEDYLTKHPEVVLKALQELEKRQATAEQGRMREVLAAHRKILERDANSEVAGNPDGDVTVVEFFDYNCPYCKKAFDEVEKLLDSDKKVRLVLKELPILGPESEVVSRAAIASRIQGKYFPYHDALMSARGRLDGNRAIQIAAEVGLDVKRLKADMQGDDVNRIINANRQLAETLQITGTPGFVIGDTIVPGYLSLVQLNALVSEARTKCVTC